MSKVEELDKVDSNEEVNNENVEENEYTPTESKAMSSGWRPEDDWTGESDDWVDAKTFNRNGEFMSRIQQQSKELNSNRNELDSLKAAMKELGEHNKKIAEQEYKNAMKSLKQEKVVALEEEDHSAVVEIEDKIDELKEIKREAETAPVEEHPVNQDVAPNPVFVEWAGTNQWYQDDVMLRGAADAIGMEYADKNQGVPIEDVLQYVTKRMTEEFPNKFGNKNKNNPSAVSEPSGTSRRGKKAKFTEKDLSDEQRQFAKTFVETGAFDNMQEYVDQLAAAGEL